MPAPNTRKKMSGLLSSAILQKPKKLKLLEFHQSERAFPNRFP